MRFLKPLLWISVTAGLFAQSLTINDILNLADQNHPEILQAHVEWKAARANIWTAVSPQNPELFAEAEGVPEGKAYTEYEEGKIGISQSIRFPTTWWLSAKAARYKAVEAKAAYQLTRQHILTDVKKQCYQILLMQQRANLLDSLATFSGQILISARVRVNSGESTSLDSLKAAVEFMTVQNRKLSAVAELNNARRSLFSLLNMDSKSVIQGDLAASIPGISLLSISECHPALQKERAHLNVQKAARAGAISSLLPDFHLKYVRVKLPDDPIPNRWTGEVGLSLPIWAWLGDQGKIRSAGYEVQAAEWQQIAQKKALQSELENARSEVQIAEQRINNFRTGMLEQSNELLRIATRSYEVGEADLITLMNAKSTWHQTQMQYLEELYHYHAAAADYQAAAGLDPFKSEGSQE